MVVACWSVKGGSGTSVVAVALALLAARRSCSGGALLVDLCGDCPALVGLPEPETGIADWLSASPDVPADALARLELDVAPGVRLLPAGQVQPHAGGVAGLLERSRLLAALLACDSRPVVVDAGKPDDPLARAVISSAARSFLVLRPCYLALRRTLTAPMRPSGVVLVAEPGRALGRRDVESVIGVPVVAEVPVEPAVARVVDAGLLSARLPRCLERGLRHVL